MSSHATAELLSAYLDQELPEEEVEVLKSHLDHCHECHGRLQSLTTVVSSLRHLEPMAPPPTLDLAVARRIALAGEKKGLIDRFEDGLEAFQRQSSVMIWFCMVIALVLIVFFFLNTLVRSQNTNIPVIFHDEPPVVAIAPSDENSAPDAPTARIFQQQGDEFKEIGETGSRIEVGGRILERGQENTWFETTIHPKVEGASAHPTYARGSESYDRLLVEHPDLAALEALNGTVYVLLDGVVIALLETETAESSSSP